MKTIQTSVEVFYESFLSSMHPINKPFTHIRSSVMKQNMGSIDKVVRVLVAVVIGILYFTDQITGIAALILSVFAVVFLLTSALGFCPLYVPLKLSTIKKKDA
jgi:hypothetical protein